MDRAPLKSEKAVFRSDKSVAAYHHARMKEAQNGFLEIPAGYVKVGIGDCRHYRAVYLIKPKKGGAVSYLYECDECLARSKSQEGKCHD